MHRGEADSEELNVKIYADHPTRRARQLITDAAVVAWILIWVALGLVVFHAVDRLGGAGRQLHDAGNSLSGSLNDAADKAGSVPLIGGSAAGPLHDAGHAAAQVAHAGALEESASTRAAVLLGLIIAAIPIGLAVLGWLPKRVRWIRSATATVRATDNLDENLLALRALTHHPLWVLQRIHPRPGAAYATGDPAVIAELARLELTTLGLVTPAARYPSSR